jgi:CheY-like chemotaxis protein
MTSKHILLVEDDPHVREACVAVLEDRAHTVVAVDDGVVALEEIERRRPDVILLDLIMPRARLDGLALLSRLAGGPRIPIIVLSGLANALQELSPELVATLSIAAILSKPVSVEALSREIDRVDGAEVG